MATFTPDLLFRRGYWCACTTHRTDRSAPRTLATLDTDTPGQAVRWMRIFLRTCGSVLDNDEFERAWQWLTAGYPATIRALTAGRPVSYATTYRDTHIEWSARPVVFLPLAHRYRQRLPDCSGVIPADLGHVTLGPGRE